MVFSFSFWFPHVHCKLIEMQLTFVCWYCILQPCWTHLLLLGVFCRFLRIFYINSYFICKEGQFYYFLWHFCTFYFLALLQHLELHILCWIRGVKAGILSLLLILERKQSFTTASYRFFSKCSFIKLMKFHYIWHIHFEMQFYIF